MADIDTEKLGAAIKRWRKERNLTQAAFGELADAMPSNTVARLERGELGVSVQTLNKLAKGFDIPASFLTMAGTDADSQGEAADLVREVQDKIERMMMAPATE